MQDSQNNVVIGSIYMINPKKAYEISVLKIASPPDLPESVSDAGES